MIDGDRSDELPTPGAPDDSGNPDAGAPGVSEPTRPTLAQRSAAIRSRVTSRRRIGGGGDDDPTARWPSGHNGPGAKHVFLTVAATSIEQRLIDAWIARHRPAGVALADVEQIAVPDPHDRKADAVDAKLVRRLAIGDDPLLVPLRIVWLPAERDGERVARLTDLVTFGDPRSPGSLRQRMVAGSGPDRCPVIAGEPARAEALRARFRQRHHSDDLHNDELFAGFVARQAGLALERAEWRALGARYKVPRLVVDEIVSRADFRAGVSQLALDAGRPVKDVTDEACADLHEMAAGHSRYMIDLSADFARWMYTQAYDESIHYDRARFDEVRALMERYPVVFLPSHKSYLDPVVMRWILHQQGLPPAHTAAGRNINFWPIGPLYRRAGAFFIRRSFKDDPVYKFVIREYIGYLVEKRFNLEWYLEGGRSRSGKLLPPKLGLLTYVVDAYRLGRTDDIIFQPVAIAYDQLYEVGAYAAEAHGAQKTKEGFGFLVNYLRSLRRRYGHVHVNFGEPISLRDVLGPPPASDPTNYSVPADEPTLDLQKLAFQVAVRINRVTPITPTSLVTLAILGTGTRALTLEEIVRQVRNFVRYVTDRDLPITEDLHLDTDDAVKQVLDALIRQDVVTSFSDGPEPVYQVGPDQQLAAAYYRNTIAHFFLESAIAELALLRADDVPVEPFPDPLASAVDLTPVFWDEVMELRDLLKFEFFFPEKDEFRAQVAAEISRHDASWEKRLGSGGADVHTIIESFHPFTAHRVLRPFLEAYQVVADALVRHDDTAVAEPGAPVDEKAFLAECLGLGTQYALRGLVTSTESASKVLFESALKLARHRNLLGAGPQTAERRRAFAVELRDVIRRTQAIEALAVGRRAGYVT